MKAIINLCFSLLATFVSLQAKSITIEEAISRGLEIATEADRRDQGWVDRSADLKMTLRTEDGRESLRSMKFFSLEVQGDGDKSMTIFEQPADVKGTAFLSFTHATEADEQWIYLPALNRVKRISTGNKSGPFMGSEFAYEDISSQEVEKYRYRYLRDEIYQGRNCFITERYPQYEHSGYTKLVEWTDTEMYQPLKIEYFDKKGILIKTLLFKNYKQYLGKFWRAQLMEMMNHQTGKSTFLAWSGETYNSGLRESDFSQNSLKRLR